MQRPIASAPQPRMLALGVEKALAGKKFDLALAQSEELVAAAPEDGGYRALLGRAYLARGRYKSARDAFQDAMALGNRDVRTVISLALVNIGLGNARAARGLLADHLDDVSAADYGLAMAMAGDAEEGVRALVAAARQPDATIQTRQNLAYALALAGAWGQARLIAGQDLAAREAEQRIGEWSRGGTGQERVIAMLGVAPRGDDAGIPARLALRKGVSELEALAQVVAPAQAPIEMTDMALPSTFSERRTTTTAALPDRTVPPQLARVSGDLMRDEAHAAFQPHEEGGRGSLPSMVAPSSQRTGTYVEMVSGSGKDSEWVVQLGAFDSAAIAQEKWRQVKSRQPRLAEFGEVFSQVSVNGRIFHRLAIRGFGNCNMAQAICRSLSAAGQPCFVRLNDNAGSRLASDRAQKSVL